MASSSFENVLSGAAKMKGSTLVETFQLLYLPPVTRVKRTSRHKRQQRQLILNKPIQAKLDPLYMKADIDIGRNAVKVHSASFQ